MNNNNNNNSIQLREEEEGDDDDDTTTHQNFPFPLTTIMSQDHIPRRDNNTHEITSTSTQQCGGSDNKPFCNGSDQSKEEPNMVQYLKRNDEDEDDAVILKLSSYKECLRNHAASIGGYAVDGCGEFMPSSPNGNKAESFKCSACGCHRNFHRKKTTKGKNVKSTTPHAATAADYPLHSHIEPPSAKGSRPSKTQHGTMMMTKWSPEVELSGSSDQAGDRHCGINVPNSTIIISGEKRGMMKKRFRTKFTNEQKEKMLRFAERAEWRIQKLDESEVQRFCQEIGIKRRVLKVWMHNNKHNYAKKNIIAN